MGSAAAYCKVRYGTKLDFNTAMKVIRHFPLADRYKMIQVDLENFDDKGVSLHPFIDLHPFDFDRQADQQQSSSIGWPSVSTLNGCVCPKKFLFEWQLKNIKILGIAEFKRQGQERMNTSNNLHSVLRGLLLDVRREGHIMRSDQQIFEENPDLNDALRSILPFFRSLPIFSMEHRAQICSEMIVNNHHLFYKGRFDAIIPINGHLTCVDWKNVNVGSSQDVKEKNVETFGLEQGKIQLAAYIHAINSSPLFSHLPKVKHGAIVQIFQSASEAKVNWFGEEELLHYHQMFLGRINAFWWGMQNLAPICWGDDELIDFVYKGPTN